MTDIERPSEQSSIHPEAGNIWFEGDEPHEITPGGAIGFYAAIALSSAVSVAIIAGAAGWVYQTIFGG